MAKQYLNLILMLPFLTVFAAAFFRPKLGAAMFMRILLLFCLAVLITPLSLAQTGILSGRVIDSKTTEPLPFANVFINNTTIGAATDVNGNFQLKNIPVGSSEVVYSFV